MNMSAAAPRSRILLVDDAPENLRILSESLRADYTIMFAKNGPDALRLAIGTPQPDLILLDVIMPGMDGYGVLARLRDNPATRDIPVVFLTALADAGVRQKLEALNLEAMTQLYQTNALLPLRWIFSVRCRGGVFPARRPQVPGAPVGCPAT